MSVIIAAHNAASTLPETLESLRAQTFTGWEAVLVDDGSTDGTGDVARRVGERIRVLRVERALGPATARNLGVEQATGELVATLDADDAWSPEFLEHQVGLYDAAVRAGRRVGIVACDAMLRGPDGELRSETFADRAGEARDISLTRLLKGNVIFTSVLMPRSVFLDFRGYAPDLPPAEDYDLWLRMLERGYELVWTPRALAVYRLGRDSLSADAIRMLANTRRVYERALERGGLSWSQRRLAHRQRRMYRLLERRAQISMDAAQGEPVLGRRLRAAPLTALVVLEHPERWLHWLRHRGPARDPSGPARHTDRF